MHSIPNTWTLVNKVGTTKRNRSWVLPALSTKVFVMDKTNWTLYILTVSFWYNDYYKIWITHWKSIEKRIKELQTWCPLPILEYYRFENINNIYEIESHIHRTLKHKQTIWERFKLNSINIWWIHNYLWRIKKSQLASIQNNINYKEKKPKKIYKNKRNSIKWNTRSKLKTCFFSDIPKHNRLNIKLKLVPY